MLGDMFRKFRNRMVSVVRLFDSSAIETQDHSYLTLLVKVKTVKT